MLRKVVRRIVHEARESIRHRYLLSPQWQSIRDSTFYPDDYRANRHVNVGSGDWFYHPNWLRCDLFSKPPTIPRNWRYFDLRADKLEKNFYKAIYTSHTLEHLPPKWLPTIVSGFFSALQENGVLRIVVPDAEILMCRYSDNDCDFFLPWAKKFAALPASIYMEVALLDLLCTPKIRDADGRIKNLDNLIEASKEFKTLLEEHGQDYRAVFNALLSEDQPNPTGSFHLNWFDFQKLSDCLTEAGFTHIRRSYYGGSRYAPMREVPLFDGTHPGMSLYVEASKCQ